MRQVVPARLRDQRRVVLSNGLVVLTDPVGLLQLRLQLVVSQAYFLDLELLWLGVVCRELVGLMVELASELANIQVDS